MEALDWLFTRMRDLAQLWLPDYADAVAFAALAMALLIGVPWAIRQLLPFVLRTVVLPVATVLLIALVGVVLAIQTVLAVPWRMLNRRPHSAIYTVGDLMLSSTISLRGSSQAAVRAINRIRRMRPYLAVVLGAVALWRWNGTYCGRTDDWMCGSPWSNALVGAQQMWDLVMKLLEG